LGGGSLPKTAQVGLAAPGSGKKQICIKRGLVLGGGKAKVSRKAGKTDQGSLTYLECVSRNKRKGLQMKVGTMEKTRLNFSTILQGKRKGWENRV